MKNLFIYFRATQADGTPAENNMMLKDIAPLRGMDDIAGLQDFVAGLYKYQTVRIMYWQRMEAMPPKIAKIEDGQS